jgi:sugar-1,4-lactone oxidase-like protein
MSLLPSQRNYRFRNWAGNQQSIASHFYQPETEEQLIDIVKSHAKVRMVGTGHSWSALCHSDEAMINLDRYNKVIALDKEKKQLTIQAGIKLWQINEYLDAEGMALINLGSIAKQSVAGAISTATHGSGIGYQVLASQVQRFTLIRADGVKVILDKDTDKETFDLAIISLGSLGVVSELTLNICEAFRLHDITSSMDFDEMLVKLDDLVQTTDHFKMWWFPHVSKIVLYHYQRTKDAANDSRFRQWLMDEVLSVVVYRALVFIGNIFPGLRPFFNSLLILSFNKPLDRIEKSYKVFNVADPPIHREAEWAFDIKDAKEVLTAYRKMIDESDHKINFIQEIRFVKGDDYALSPSYQRDSIWIGCYLIGDKGWPQLLGDFEKLAQKYKGRPHWGKEYNMDRNYIRSQYPRLDDFNKLRLDLDPSGKFSNPMIARLFE